LLACDGKVSVPTTIAGFTGFGNGVPVGAGTGVVQDCDGGIVLVTVTLEGLGVGCEDCCADVVVADTARASRQRVKLLFIILRGERRLQSGYGAGWYKILSRLARLSTRFSDNLSYPQTSLMDI